MAKGFFDKPLKVRIVRGFLLALVVSLGLIYIPTPFRLEAPGITEDVGKIIHIESRTYPVKGVFLLPTVVSEPATLLYCIYGLINPDAVLLTDSPEAPMAQSPGGDHQMELSQYLSTIIALEALGHKVRGTFTGLRVLDVVGDSPNKNHLLANDLMTSLNGRKLESFADFKKIVENTSPGHTIQGTVIRDGRPVEVTLKVYQPQGRSVLGIVIRPELDTKFPFDVEFKSGSTIGASGGLVFALEIYNQLTPRDLTGGKMIAATGTLDAGGNVGGIQGLEFKIRGAYRAGASLMLVPKDNAGELRMVPEGLEVIPVASFNEALDVLEKRLP